MKAKKIQGWEARFMGMVYTADAYTKSEFRAKFKRVLQQIFTHLNIYRLPEGIKITKV